MSTAEVEAAPQRPPAPLDAQRPGTTTGYNKPGPRARSIYTRCAVHSIMTVIGISLLILAPVALKSKHDALARIGLILSCYRIFCEFAVYGLVGPDAINYFYGQHPETQQQVARMQRWSWIVEKMFQAITSTMWPLMTLMQGAMHGATLLLLNSEDEMDEGRFAEDWGGALKHLFAVVMGIECLVFLDSLYMATVVLRRGCEDILPDPSLLTVATIQVCTFEEFQRSLNTQSEKSFQPTRSSACPVCFEGFDLNQEIIQLPCGHIFHRHCGAAWLVSEVTCPLRCNQTIPPNALGRFRDVLALEAPDGGEGSDAEDPPQPNPADAQLDPDDVIPVSV